MWTDTHYYRFPDQATAEGMALPDICAIDHVGVIEGAEGHHVNARWWGEEPEAWEAYRIPAPNNPVRVFA
jgi:hypothetical protein